MKQGSKGIQNRTAEHLDRDADYWRARYEKACEERDEAEFKLHELARQVHQWALSEFGASDAMMAMYRRSGEMGERIPAPSRAGVVYYVRQPGDRIKIGFTTSFLGRMQTLYVQMEDVLAVELGGMEMESARHAQFAADRVGRTELFTLSEELTAHIEALRAASPEHPWHLGVRPCRPDMHGGT